MAASGGTDKKGLSHGVTIGCIRGCCMALHGPVQPQAPLHAVPVSLVPVTRGVAVVTLAGSGCSVLYVLLFFFASLRGIAIRSSYLAGKRGNLINENTRAHVYNT